MKHILIAGLLVFLSNLTPAQNNHNHEHHHHTDLHNYHVGIGGAATYLKSESQFAPGVHVHFIRQFGHQNRWGLGLGFETIFDEHQHNGINLLVNYHPLKQLSVNAGPGILLTTHDGEKERKPAFHTEAVYEFNVGKFHLGPMVGFGFDKDEAHFSMGVHVGLGF